MMHQGWADLYNRAHMLAVVHTLKMLSKALATHSCAVLPAQKCAKGKGCCLYSSANFEEKGAHVCSALSSLNDLQVPYTGALSLNLGSLINVYLSNFASGQNTTNNIWATLAAPSLVTHSE